MLNTALQLIEIKCSGIKVVVYADDTTVLFQRRTEHVREDIMQFNGQLSVFVSFFNSFRLAINTNKAELFIFRAIQCKLENPVKTYLINNTLFDTFITGGCLGFTLSSDFKWKEHLAVAVFKCYAIIATLTRPKQLGYRLAFLSSISRLEIMLSTFPACSCHLKLITVVGRPMSAH